MPPSRLFFEPDGSIDTTQVLLEAIPLAKLVGAVVAVAVVPLSFVLLLGDGLLGALFALLAQFVLAVGGGVVLLYVVVRSLQLADGSPFDGDATRPDATDGTADDGANDAGSPTGTADDGADDAGTEEEATGGA